MPMRYLLIVVVCAVHTNVRITLADKVVLSGGAVREGTVIAADNREVILKVTDQEGTRFITYPKSQVVSLERTTRTSTGATTRLHSGTESGVYAIPLTGQVGTEITADLIR